MAITAFRIRNSRGRASGQRIKQGESPYRHDHRLVAGHVAVMRLVGKRQVFNQFSERSVGADTRLSHTCSVWRVADMIAQELHLNQHLTAAMALCHDVAHCPYGHLGENTLNAYLKEIGAQEYDHVDVAPYLLYNLFGLDLTYEVLNGITWHSFSSGVMRANVPSEFRVVACCRQDRIFVR